MPKLCSKKREMKFENHSFIINSGTKGWQPRFCCVRSVGCTNVLTCPLSGAHFVEPACGCSLELATDCGPTPTHTLLANEASPQQNAAVNYGCPWLKDELSHAVRARLVIRLFKVNSFSVETTLTCLCAERLQFCADWVCYVREWGTNSDSPSQEHLHLRWFRPLIWCGNSDGIWFASAGNN